MMCADQLNSRRASYFLQQMFICFGFVFVCGVAAVLLGKDVNWDLLDYHYYNGYAYIHHRYAQDVMPALNQTYMNPYYDVVNYWLIALHNVRLSVFLLGAISGLNTFLLYKIALLVFPASMPHCRALSISAVMIFSLFGAGNLSLLGTTTNDTKLALLSLLALYCMLKVLVRSKHSLFYLLTAAFLSGLGAAFKLPAACYAIGLFMAFLLVTPWNRQQVRLYLVFLLFVMLGFLVANGSWMYFLYQHFSNPLFPYYNNIFHSPYAPFISFNFSASPKALAVWQIILLPFLLAINANQLASEVVLRDMHFAVVVVLSSIFVCQYLYYQGRRRSKKNFFPVEDTLIWDFVFTYFWVNYFVWLLMFAVYRYALPLEMLSSLLIVMLLLRLTRKTWQVYSAIVLLLIGFAWNTQPPDWSRAMLGKAYFSAEIPVLPPRATIILMNAPLAYLIPSFPADTHFIGFPFVNLGEENLQPPHLPTDKHQKMLSEVIAQISLPEMQGKLYTLAVYPGAWIAHSGAGNKRSISVLKHFGFRQDIKHCVLFESNVQKYLQLCPLIKT